jgi:pimeloyl-ACP methyl ester carboxylesterase
MKPRSIVFIHGMFMTPTCWDGWVTRFQQQGFHPVAPAWPLHDAPAAEQRQRHPDGALGQLTLDQIVEHYAKLIAALDEKPIMIGHSMGGLIVQLLLARALGSAGVAIDSAPPKGVVSLKWSFLKSNWPVISPFAKKSQPYLLTPEEFRYAFAHTLSPDDLRAAFDREVVPESRIVGNAPTTAAARIDFNAKRPPLLMIAGGADRIIPASLNWSNYKKYNGGSVTEFREFPDRTHYTLAQAGWEAVSDFAIDWLRKNAAQP